MRLIARSSPAESRRACAGPSRLRPVPRCCPRSAAAPTSSRRNAPSITTSPPTEWTAPNSCARSTGSEPRWCRATARVFSRTATESFRRCSTRSPARSDRSISRPTSSTTGRSPRVSPRRSANERARASTSASWSTAGGRISVPSSPSSRRPASVSASTSPLRLYSIEGVGRRTHRRILTIDGRIGFCGGVAIDDRWMGDARDPSEWRDTMIEIEGPVVVQLQHVFAQDWIFTTGEVLNGDRQFPEVAPAGTLLAQAIAASRADCDLDVEARCSTWRSRRRGAASGSRTRISRPTGRFATVSPPRRGAAST